jgi:signal transduction histidine kinase
MRFRNARLRTKITALLLSLAALWAFAAWVTLREGLNLVWLSTLDAKTGRPGNTLVTNLQQERRLSLISLSTPTPQQRAALDAQRGRTDEAKANFLKLAGSSEVSMAAGAAEMKRIKETFKQLDGLAAGRAQVDARRVDRTVAATPFNDIIDSVFRIYGSSASVDNQDIAKDSRTLIALTRAKEILSREDALLASVLAAGRFTSGEHAQFVELAGAQRLLHAEAVAELPDADRARYEQLVSGADFTRFRAMEDRMIQFQEKRAKVTPPLPVGAQEWESVMGPVLTGLEKVVLTGGDGVVERAKPVAIGVILRVVLAAGLGLIAVISSVVLSITTARALVQQLEKLRVAAWELAEKRLPSVVERLGHGEEVDVAAEAPSLSFGSDAIGQVGRAFNAVQETAIRTAVEQAELRRGIRDILLSLARRSQALVHRQLTLLDTMERREIETQELEDLFRVDHLATRMRRNAENLIVLSGSTPARGWRRSVAMVDVVRAAVAEIEDYTRVTVMPIGPVALNGRAVGDITHLLAELIENAVSFSPPYTVVQISGHMAAGGYAIEVEDRGLGMTDENLAGINERIADPPEFNLSSSVQLGLYVVGRLAERYGVRVSLKRSPYGGTTAVVLVPRELVIEDENAPDYAAPMPVAVGVADEAARSQPQAVRTLSPEPAGPSAFTVISEQGTPAPVNGAGSPSISRSEEGVEPETPPVPEMSHTPSGLPFRVPQASLAPPLRTDGPTSAVAEEGEENVDPGRSPEEIRKMVGAFQKGTQRGRNAAEGALGRDDDPPQPPPASLGPSDRGPTPDLADPAG